MGLKTSFLLRNPINNYLISKRRERLTTEPFSLLSSNCLGGLLMSMLGVPFLTPWVKNKWNERKSRILPTRMFFLLNDCDGVTEDDLCLLDSCEHQNIIVFTSNPNSKHRCTFYLPVFKGLPCVGNTMVRSWITGKFIIERYFDIVGWLNQERGAELENYRIR